MPPREPHREAGRVEVRIWFDQSEPPVGHVQRLAAPGASSDRGAATTEFSGWLGLLRALSDVLDDAKDIPPKPCST
jgi:hypothetical protein